MNLIEMNDKLLISKKKTVTIKEIPQEKLIEFKSLIAISKTVESAFETIEDANAFYKMFPYIKKLIGSNICVEVFYACKLGYFYSGIPAKLLFILNKAIRSGDRMHINATLNKAVNLLRTYCDSQWKTDENVITMKDVIENIVGEPVNLITSSTLKVQAKDCWEVYIKDAERVALVPNDIATMLSYGDCEKLQFDIGKGIVLGDVPIRTLNNRIGITKDDFDLRECF